MLVLYCNLCIVLLCSITSLTSAWSEQKIFTCPTSGKTVIVPSGDTTLRLALSSSGQLCTLTQRSENGNIIIPVSRSYDSNPWEAVAGPYSSLKNIDCKYFFQYCEIDAPALNPTHYFALESFEHNLSVKDEAARFFEQSSFGVTTSDLNEVENKVNDKKDLLPYFAEWTYSQIYDINPTSHRGYWRRRTFPFYEKDGREGRATRPCEIGSFWRAYAFSETDKKKTLNVKVVDGKFAFFIDDKFRTIVNKFELEGADAISFPASFQVCHIDAVVGGSSIFRHKGECRDLIGGNPTISIEGMQPEPALIVGKKAKDTIMNGDQIEIMTLQSFISNGSCDVENQPFFLKIDNGTFMQTMLYEPRLALRDNLMLNPLSDGGGGIMKKEGGERAQCSNVPRTFLNEEYCRLATDDDTCAPRELIEGYIKLTPFNIKRFYSGGGKFVYAVNRLRLSDDMTIESACKHGVRSRWKIDDVANGICDVNIHSETASMFRTMLLESDDYNPHIKDLYLSTNEKCHSDDLHKVEITVKVGSHCWKTIHPDNLNVYDFTYWSNHHPGNAANALAIKQFARNGEHFLFYPSFHGMHRWNEQKRLLPYLGRLGDVIDYREFPDSIRYPKIGNIFDLVIPSTYDGKKGIVCGSPNEVGTGDLYPTSFSMTRRPELEFLKLKQFHEQKKSVWGMVTLNASDQLRQRAAWAISQIFVVAPSSIQFWFQTESFLNYYDIFVRNSLGNFRDILREVAYSPMMGEMLSYLGSRSSEYVWEKEREVQFADENFAREIMQLFSIGLVKLNIDGTVKHDSNGDTIATYNNDIITEYSRVWTGFRRQEQRANVEERGINVNSIDPMAIHVKFRDQFPKMGLETYIGDGYPICNELPRDVFLKANAKYRLLGKSKQSDLQNIDPNSVIILDGSSFLLDTLCKRSPNGWCTYPGVVKLEKNIRCTTVECKVTSPPQLLQVGQDIYYEYIKPECVNFPLSKQNTVLVIDVHGKVAIERKNAPFNGYHSLTFFRVQWKDEKYPNAQNNSCGGCQPVGNWCRCETTVEEERVFSSMPTRDEILSKLHIGALLPSILSYASTEIHSDYNVYSMMTHQILGRNSAFLLQDRFGRRVCLKNMLSSIVMLRSGSSDKTQFQFRNPPCFFGDNPEGKDARDETEAALDHYFYHDNTAPFIGLRLIQRFGISNPSPRYVKAVALAFRSGKYQAPNASQQYGTGNYGDLAATVAAILLDKESRSSVLDLDPSFGGIREPLLKTVAMLRSMEYKHTSRQFFALYNLYSSIGQAPYEYPSVFSFFLPEFSPPGIIAKSSLVAPEAMATQNSIGFLNGMLSLVKNGLNSCDAGFGVQKHCDRLSSNGYLSYFNHDVNVNNIVDDIATRLTSGRLSQFNRDLMIHAYLQEKNQTQALQLAQQMVILSPEFAATGIVKNSYSERPQLSPTVKSCKRHKAVVHILLKGGCDSFNLLVPHSECKGKDMYEEYKSVRGSVALSKEELLPIDANDSNQICSRFGLHPNLPFVQKLYDEGDAAFFAGVGVLSEPVNQNDYWFKTKTQLFAHNTVQAAISRLDPFKVAGSTGTLGRLADSLSREYKVNAFSIDTTLVALEGNEVKIPKTAVNSEMGFHKFNPSASDVISSTFGLINGKQESDSNFFSNTWSSTLHESVVISNRLYEAEKSVKLTTSFPNNTFGRQLETVSKVIASHECRGSDRDLFYFETGSFDAHSQVLPSLQREFNKLNDGLDAFVNEMKSLNVWDDIVVVVSSDFGRTLTGNSGGGTDHGWSGNSFMLGGSINGGKIFGEFPNDLTSESHLSIGRGRLIPTIPFDAIWNGVSQWMGVYEESELLKVLPNRETFSDLLFNNDELFLERRSKNDIQCENGGKEIFCRSKDVSDDNAEDDVSLDDKIYDDQYYNQLDDNYRRGDSGSSPADKVIKKPIAVAIFLTVLTFLIIGLGVYVNFYRRYENIKWSEHVETFESSEQGFSFPDKSV